MTMRSSALRATAPLIGRHRELRTLDLALQRVNRASPAVIRLHGEIGIGRTRLLQEFAEVIGTQQAGMLITGSGRYDDSPLEPLRAAHTQGPLEGLQAAISSPGSEDDVFGHIIAAIADTARRLPVWLLIDDVHAADDATQVLVERLVAALQHGTLRGRRVGLVLSLVEGRGARPLQRKLDALDYRNATVHLSLEGFSTDEVRSWLVSRFAVAPSTGLVKLLSETSGGNPLLLCELANQLQRSDLLCEVDGYLTTGVDTAGLALPRNLIAALEQKIQSVSAECRRAMTLAAFLGNDFEPETLARLLQQEGAQIDTLLAEAEGAALIENQGTGTVRFTHSAAREYFYARPDQQHREENHLRISEQLIHELGGTADEYCLAITHHIVRAGALADPATVLRFATRAGEIAFQHHSYYLAGRYFEAAAGAAARLLPAERRAGLYCDAGEAFQRWSDAQRSAACFQAAIRLYGQCEDLPGYARALQGMLRNHIAFGEPGSDTTAVADDLQRLVGGLPEACAELRVRVLDTLAAYHHGSNRFDAAEQYAQAAMAVAGNSEDPALRCIPVTSLALAQMEQLRLIDAKTTWLEGLSFDRAAGAVRYEGLHLQRLPAAMYCMGEIHEAAGYNQRSYQHNRSIGNTGELCLNLTIDVMIANLRGDFAAAIAAGQEAMELMTNTRYLWSAAPLISALAHALTMTDRFDDANAIVDHLSTDGLTFQSTRPYRGTATRLRELIEVYRCGNLRIPAPRADTARQTPRDVRLGSVNRLCCEVELALLQRRPERLGGVHDTLEFLHRRGVAAPLGWCSSVPRALGVSATLRGDSAGAAAYFDAAGRLAQRWQSPLEAARLELSRALAELTVDADAGSAAVSRLARAQTELAALEAPALAALARRAAEGVRQSNQTT